MAEYIVEIDHPELCVEYGGTNSTDRLERIVRCKDCRNMVPAGYVSLGSNSAWHESCLKLSSWDSEHDWMEWFYTEPDCFCAWGERREK